MRFRLLLLVALLSVAPLPGQGWAAALEQYIETALKQRVDDARNTGGLDAHSISGNALLWFYAERGYAPVWNRGDRLEQLVVALEGLEKDGLDPEYYGVSKLRRKLTWSEVTPAGTACVDLLATDAYLGAMLHLGLGRLDPSEVEPIWLAAGPEALEEQRLRLIMLAASMTDDVEGAFAHARPSTPQYRGLREAYVELLRRPRATGGPVVPPGPLLREGDRDARVPLLRERLREGNAGEGLPAVSGGDLYDAELVAAVMAFQRAHGLAPDGIVGPETRAALNRDVSSVLQQIRVNLERMRWLARVPVSTGVVVDIAGAEIRYVRDGETVWSARTQVGRPSRQTPRLRSEVTHLTFNPTWTVPPTILRQDVLPRVREDLGYLAANRMQVLDYHGNALPPEEVDWRDPDGIMLRQDPGPHNALGRVAIRFPNPFHVYLHDTPSRPIFERPYRQVSSGCVRVERPMELVDLLVEDGSDAGPERAAELAAHGSTRNFYLTRPVPILIGYWTADVAADGSVALRRDTYGRDENMARALAQQGAADQGALDCSGVRDPYRPRADARPGFVMSAFSGAKTSP